MRTKTVIIINIFAFIIQICKLHSTYFAYEQSSFSTFAYDMAYIYVMAMKITVMPKSSKLPTFPGI